MIRRRPWRLASRFERDFARGMTRVSLFNDDVHDAIWRYLDPDHCAMGVLRGEIVNP